MRVKLWEQAKQSNAAGLRLSLGPLSNVGPYWTHEENYVEALKKFWATEVADPRDQVPDLRDFGAWFA